MALTIPTLLAIDAVCQIRSFMSVDDLMLMLRAFSASAFRIETLPQYLVEEEAEALERFRVTREVDSASLAEWAELISGHVSAGHAMRRVHLVRLPLTDYLRWEFAVQAASVEAGEEIRLSTSTSTLSWLESTTSGCSTTGWACACATTPTGG